jgi:hypothetical protein
MPVVDGSATLASRLLILGQVTQRLAILAGQGREVVEHHKDLVVAAWSVSVSLSRPISAAYPLARSMSR